MVCRRGRAAELAGALAVRRASKSRFHVSTDSNAGGRIPVHDGKKLNARQRRALAILAGAGPRGCAEAILMAHGFPIEVLAGLVRSGLAGAALEAPERLAMMMLPAVQRPAASARDSPQATIPVRRPGVGSAAPQ